MYGILGKKLGHSFSAKVFEKQFGKSHEFKIIELESIDVLPEYLNNNIDLKGFSVTIPYKKTIIPFISVLDNISKEIKAVNTIFVKNENEKTKLYGYNTDVYGFTEAYKSYFSKIHKNAIILGTGGASDAVNYALQQLGIETLKVSRNKTDNNTITYTQLTDDIISKNKIIVNATPLGMFPNIETFPNINYSAISKDHVAIDLTYNPEETSFMKKARAENATVLNGFKMLELQAKKAWEIWGLI
jgi:shikimate dehydrogenase